MKHPLSALLVLSLLALPLAAHEGHDHGDEKKALPNLGNTPQRQADGSVFLPKSAQRQMAVRTLPVAAEDVPRVLELAGKVVMDPNRGGRVQTMISGRIEAAGNKGLPAGGQRVKQGEVLAWVVASAGQIERAGQSAQLAALKAEHGLAEKRLARLQSLADSVPRKEIEAAESAVQSLAAQISAIGGGLAGREALVAPVSGVIAASNVVVGQVVEARELVFEIIDPDRLSIEALAYEPVAIDAVKSASVALGETALALTLSAANRRLRDQALPLLFGHQGAGAGMLLPLGQPVRIQLQLQSTVQGVPVPQQAMTRSPANETMVWVKTAPERFAPRPVTTVPLDGVRLLVTAGLKSGDRVVTDGASLISQIR
jgi:membrane fusion protein, heavy metal efflux system